MGKRIANPAKVEELSTKLGDVPSGKTAQGEIDELNSNMVHVEIINKSIQLNANGENSEVTFENNETPIIGVLSGWYYLFAYKSTGKYSVITIGTDGNNLKSRAGSYTATVSVVCLVTGN